MFHRDCTPSDVWSTYYDESYLGQSYSCLKIPKYAFVNKYCFLYRCKFLYQSSSVINYKTDGSKLLYSECIFKNCSNNGIGGCIYYRCKSSIVQHIFCALYFHVTDEDTHFSCTNLISADFINYAIEGSISFCGDTEHTHITAHHCGKIIYSSLTFSKNDE